ncbi:chromate efflux transporter [Roseateles sp. SL47]|uniref:chromate efflux transporter n=1 Tax=Roseateles sp. SL47 TaxID=2995138 RepID=UPI0022705B57|nr:chromate efflux transporter [Roseateles sp. SL47]WAC73683.1 chromate efflux transporter [Roseateles sp. SL47]
MTASRPASSPRVSGSVWEVFVAFLVLGLTSFGGPMAHMGYFRTEFVQGRQWLSDEEFSDLVALCQCLPGPSSSQVGIGLGLGRAGWGGALAAWVGFTAPSAVLLTLVALGIQHWVSAPVIGALHGLKVLAVAIVAQAVWGMARSLCPDWPRALLACGAAAIALSLPAALGQLGAIAVGACVGVWWLPGAAASPPPAAGTRSPVSRRAGLLALLIFVALLVTLFLMAQGTDSRLWGALWVCYRASSLVFGGGHVVLPMLEVGFVQPGWLSAEQFLSGYGAAQAVPGPLFTFAAYLGATSSLPGLPSPWLGAGLLLLAIFTPAFLTVIAALPFWHALRERLAVRRALAGVNAAVVGMLGAALITSIGTSALGSIGDLVLAVIAWVLLLRWRCPPVALVVLAAMGGAVLGGAP